MARSNNRKERPTGIYTQHLAPMSEAEVTEKLEMATRSDGTQICTGFCGEELPATSEYFDRDATREHGLRSVCKTCRAKMRQLEAYEAVDTRVRNLDARSLDMLDTLVRAGAEIPHIAEIYQRVMEAFEGPGGFAAHLMGQYLMAKPGSIARGKILSEIMRLAAKVSDSGAAQIPVNLLDDEDLAIAFEKGVQKFVPRISNDDGAAEKAS